MAIGMYQLCVPTYIKHLNGLANCLKKTQAAYAEKKYDEGTLLNYRLFPDMFHFTKQVQAATDHARTSAALLSGVEAPKFDDSEKSLADLIGRVEKTIAYLQSIKAEQVDGTEAKAVTIKMRDRELSFKGQELIQNRAMPNFYFHTTTAYNIMRHNGIELGKRDFMGS